MYLSWYQSDFRPTLMKIFKILLYSFVKEQIPFTMSDINLATKQIFNSIKQLDQLLEGKKYICGDMVTIADLLLFFEVTNMVTYELPYEKYTNVKRWFK